MRSLSLKNVWIIARREFLERVRTKSFIIMTLIFPVMMFGLAVLPSLFAMKRSTGSRTVVIVNQDAALAEAIKQQLKMPPPDPFSSDKPKAGAGRSQDEIRDMHYTVTTSGDLSAENRQALLKQIDAKSIDGFLWLPQEAVAERKFEYVARSTSDFGEMGRLQSAVSRAVTRLELGSRGVAPAEADHMLKRMTMETVTWENGKEKKGSGIVKLLSSILLVVTIYVTLLMYGMNVMRAVLEEKTNRIMEVLMSSVSAADLLSGKIIGVGAVGLVQIAVWTSMAAVLAVPGAFSMSEQIKNANFTALTAVYFVAFYLLGYLLYSALFAALGAMVNSEQEAQQLQFIVMLPLIISTMLMMPTFMTPNDPKVVVASMIPFCAPIIMYMRIIVQTPPFWQIALSMAIMAATIVFVVFFCARIYRVGILMYGKKPNLPEIIKWIRYA